MDLKKVENIYKAYGFEVKSVNDQISVFLYKKGRYFGVDILLLEENEIEIELFNSFFSYESTRHRLKKKYDDFVSKQTKNLIGNNYEYIGSPYELFNGEMNESPNDLMQNVLKILERCQN